MQLFCNDAEWNRCKTREKRASLAFRILAAATPAVFILLCLLTCTRNARTMHPLMLCVTAVLGGAALAVYILLLRPARRELRHMEMLRNGEKTELEGVLTLTRETIRVPRSVLVRRVILETGQERPALLNVDERWAHRMPPDGARVRVAAVHSYIAGAETAGEYAERGEEAETRKPSRVRAFFRGAAALTPVLILWMFGVLIFGSFIFYQITDTDHAHKIVIYIDGTTVAEDQLAARLEDGLEDPVRLVQVRPFSYEMFGGELQTADLYIVPDSRWDLYAEWYAPEEESLVVFDPETGIAAAGAYIVYTPEGEEPEVWRLYFGASSPHLEDGLARKAAELLTAETEKEATE